MAALLTLGAMICFALMGIFIRYASESLHVLEIVFFRNVLAIVLMTPWLLHHGFGVMKTRRMGLYSARALLNIVGMAAGFAAITMIPLAEATALSFTLPLFATLGAVLLLGEVVRLRRITALVIGFAGMLIILRPGFQVVSVGAILAVAGAVAIALTLLIVKKLTDSERPETIVIYMALLQAPLALVPALFVWSWPDPTGWLWLFCLAGSGTVGHLLYTRALRMADVSQIQPIDFIRLPLVVVLGYLLFGEIPTLWTLIGGVIIFAATVYVTHREARLASTRAA